MPFSTSSLILAVRYIHTPRPYSKKWMFHDSSFIFSLAWGKGSREPGVVTWGAGAAAGEPQAPAQVPRVLRQATPPFSSVTCPVRLGTGTLYPSQPQLVVPSGLKGT